MSKGNLSTRRVQTLINKSNHEFQIQAELQVKKIKFAPTDPTSGLVAADHTFSENDSGKVILIDASGEANLTMTLPTAEVGMHFTFMLGANSHANSEVIIDAGSGVNIRGISTGVGNATYVNINSRTVGFADAEKRGAMIELVYTGHWFIKHTTSTVALITSFS
jgi:hypothetical protein